MTLGHSVGIDKKPPYLVAAIALVDDDLQLRLVEDDNESVKAAENSKQ